MAEALKGACIVGQSGGPTSVTNATIYGVIRTALDSEQITKVYGAAHGITGVLDDVLYDMGMEDEAELELLLHTPSAALGSCRYKLADYEEDDTDYKRILEIFQKYDVRYFFYNGGNDSMDTCHKLSEYMRKVGYACRVMGIPKTIDNDLFETDHCPGYASAAKYIITSCMELYHDVHVYDKGMICVIEAMGRHAGWLAASSAIAARLGSGPDLIYLPERDFDMEAFIRDVRTIYQEKNSCMIVVSEGIHDGNGKLIAEYLVGNISTDAFGHKQLGGLAATLADILKKEIGTKVRGIELSLLQRCATHCASETDIRESFICGEGAVEYAVSGETDKMVGIERCQDDDGNYFSRIKLVALSDVANAEKKVPLSWINEAGNNVTDDIFHYVFPLMEGSAQITYRHSFPQFARLKKIRAAAAL